MPVTWTAEVEAKLLLGVLDQVRGAKLDYKALAAFMGPEFTVASLTQRMFKLRRDAGIPVSSPGKASGVRTPATDTPKKRKLAAALETPTKKGKACRVSHDCNDDVGDGGEDAKLVIKEEDEKKLNTVDLAG